MLTGEECNRVKSVLNNKGRLQVDEKTFKALVNPAPAVLGKNSSLPTQKAKTRGMSEVPEAGAKIPKVGKYKNIKVPDPRGGRDFDSILEGKHGVEYYMMEEKGLIQKVERQHPFVLHAGIKWVCDFLLTHLDGSLEAVDSKGVETPEFKLKKKLFLKDYPHIKMTIRKAKEPSKKSRKGKNKGGR